MKTSRCKSRGLKSKDVVVEVVMVAKSFAVAQDLPEGAQTLVTSVGNEPADPDLVKVRGIFDPFRCLGYVLDRRR